MKTIIKKVILLSCLSATLAWGADDDDFIGKKRKYEEPEEEEVQQSGANPGGNARKAFKSSMEQSRQPYVNARTSFLDALTGNPEGKINPGNVIQNAKDMIKYRLSLHRLLVANVEDSQIKAAYLAALFLDLYNILTAALPSINTVFAGGMNEFLKNTFGEIDCRYNGNNLIEYLAKALRKLSCINDDQIKSLCNLFTQYQLKDLQSVIKFLNHNFRIFYKNPVNFYNNLGSPFWMIIFSELSSQDSLLTLLKKSKQYGSSPLHSAFANSNTDLIKALLDANIFTPENWLDLVQTRNESLSTPLHWAFMNGNTDLIKALLDANIFTPGNWLKLLQIPDKSRTTPLHFAFAHGHTDLIKALLEANILTPENWLTLLQTMDKHLITPLHWACRNGRASIFKLLLEYCQQNPQFAGMLKKLLADIQGNKPLTPKEYVGNEKKQETQEALHALLAWLYAFNPSKGCNEEKHSFSQGGGDDDDDPQGGGASSGNPQGSETKSVITITMPGNLATHPMGTRQTGSDNPSKKAAAFSVYSI